MDSYSNMDLEENFLARSLKISEKENKGEPLMSLTAKYKKSRNGANLFTNNKIATLKHGVEHGGINIGVAPKYHSTSPHQHIRQKNTVVPKPVFGNSSEEECSDTESSGLVALAAKHKIKQNNEFYNPHSTPDGKKCVDNSSNMHGIQDQLDDSDGDMSSETEGSSLLRLISKHKVASISVAKDCITNIPINVEGKFGVSDIKSDVTLKDSIGGIITESSSDKCIAFPSAQKTFMTTHFSDDSDSDESFGLSGLIRKHNNSVSQGETGSADDIQQLKPRELSVIANYHRQHTKSESDRFSTPQMTQNNLITKGFENETSTSLSSLRGSVPSDCDFEFSLGCNFPHSFKSKSIVNNLTSSLRCVKIPPFQINTNNSFSDPNVSVDTKIFDKANNESTLDPNHFSLEVSSLPVDSVDGLPEGINLSCAIKSASSAKISESGISEDHMDVFNEPEDEEIVTLLDNLIVDDDTNDDEDTAKMDAKNASSFRVEVIENCTYDSSDILKVKVKLQTGKCSPFGKVICRRRRLQTPYFRKENLVTSVIPFKFITPSPDDIHIALLKRNNQVLCSEN